MMTKKKLYFFVFTACLAGYIWVVLNLIYHSSISLGCLFHKITHIPCPSCGSTRSILSLLDGNISDALYLNPIGILLFFGMTITPLWIIFDVVTGKDYFFHSYIKFESLLRKNYIAIPSIFLLLVNWIWNLFKYL